MQNLVAQRHGEGSPITKYIGRYEKKGEYKVPDTGQSENIMATVEPGETIHFSGAPKAPDTKALLSGEIHQPLLLDRKGGAHRLPKRGTGMHVPGTDIFLPPENEVSGLEKAFGYFGALASKFTKNPYQSFRDSEEWTTTRDYKREIERSQLQSELEGRNLNPLEILRHHRMRERIGAPSQRVYRHGQVREEMAHGVVDPTGQGRRSKQETTWDEMQQRFVPTPDKKPWFVEAMESPDKTDDKIYRNRGTEVAVAQWNPDTRTKQYKVWNPETPDESSWRAVQAGYGDAAVARLRGDDLALLQDAESLEAVLDKSSFKETGGRKTPIGTFGPAFKTLRGRISRGTLSAYATPEEMKVFYATKKRLSEMLAEHGAKDFPRGADVPEGMQTSPENYR